MNHNGAVLAIMRVSISQEEFEGTKGAIRIRKSKKERQHNCQKKKGHKDKQRSIKHYTEN